MLVSLCLNTYFIYLAWKQWDDTPVVVTLQETTSPMNEVPFPAVTVCPQTKFASKFYRLKPCIHNGTCLHEK
jgi:amiloride-sensitive sodium channel